MINLPLKVIVITTSLAQVSYRKPKADGHKRTESGRSERTDSGRSTDIKYMNINLKGLSFGIKFRIREIVREAGAANLI